MPWSIELLPSSQSFAHTGGESRPFLSYGLGSPRRMGYLRLYPLYLRADLAAQQAAAAFQEILDNPGVVQNEPIGALSHLGRGRAYAMARARHNF